MNSPSISPVLAALNLGLIKILFFVGFLIVGGIVRRISEAREQAARMKPPSPKPQSPSPPKRDNQFRNEIEAFLEEVGRRRAPSNPSGRPGVDPGAFPVDRTAARMPQRPEPPKPLPVPRAAPQPASRAKPAAPKSAPPPALPPRPGVELAARKSPVSANMGGQVRTHLAEYLDSSRMKNQVQLDVGNNVERVVRQHLGETMTRGTAENEPVAVATRASLQIASLLRNPSGMRTAIMVSEILGRPKGLRRKA